MIASRKDSCPERDSGTPAGSLVYSADSPDLSRFFRKLEEIHGLFNFALRQPRRMIWGQKRIWLGWGFGEAQALGLLGRMVQGFSILAKKHGGMRSLAFGSRYPTFGAMKLRQMWGTPATGWCVFCRQAGWIQGFPTLSPEITRCRFFDSAALRSEYRGTEDGT
jgi:hypothetical protein